ncbi:MAG: sulfite exporter TauE/SafE family protein [Nostocaceae cyanobacterium]|nr:sulfite exporter TauE/SafE family protein [Nostocaceae cyanobacterium]
MKAKWRRYRLYMVSFFGSLLLAVAFASPTLAHWADLAAAEIMVGEKQTQITLTFPTGLVTSADDNQDGQLSAAEVRKHQGELEKFLGDRIRLVDVKGGRGNLSIATVEANLGPTASIAPNTHSTLQLLYSWQQPVQGLKMHYDLFLKEAPAAHCMATILNQGQVQNFMFTRQNRELWLMGGGLQFGGSWLVTVFAAFLWGAMHALSPGHGKTIVGAYLVGSRATPQHAIFLGLTTTLTHTIGVFALGLITLFASQYILPERLLPWLSIVSGVMVVAIGLNLFISRFRGHHHHDHDHDHHHHHHDHDHHHHDHDHDHDHLPPDDAPITWQSLLALGISGGLVPCPSALVLLLSAVAFGRTGLALALVLAFSLGLAGVLIGLGLLLVYAKRRFEKLPKRPIRLMHLLPTLSALCISLLGVGITARALMEIANGL